MVIGNVASSDLTSTFSSISLFNSFKVVTPPHIRSFDITFTSLYLNTGTYYEIDSSTNTYTPVAGTLTGLTLTANSYFVNDVTTYSCLYFSRLQGQFYSTY